MQRTSRSQAQYSIIHRLHEHERKLETSRSEQSSSEQSSNVEI